MVAGQDGGSSAKFEYKGSQCVAVDMSLIIFWQDSTALARTTRLTRTQVKEIQYK